MSDIAPIAGPPSPREDPDELRHFNEAMKAPLEILAALGEGRALPKLTNPHRFQLAKVCVKKDGDLTRQFLSAFNLLEDQYIEIVMTREDPKELLRFQKAMEDPLRVLATLRRRETLRSTLTEEHCFEVAMRCSQEDVDDTARKIKSFGLNQEARFKVAQSCAEKNPLVIMDNINDFDLTTEQRFELAKFCAGKNGYSMATRLPQFNLPENLVTEVVLIVSRDVTALEPILPYIYKWVRSNDPNGMANSLIVLSEWINREEWETLTKKSDPEMQKATILRAADMLHGLLHESSREQILLLSKRKCLFNILALRAPHLHRQLAQYAWEAARHPLHFKEVADRSLALLELPLAKMKAAGVNVDTMKFSAKSLANNKKFIPFLHCILLLADNLLLSADKKTEIIRAMTMKMIDLNSQIEQQREVIRQSLVNNDQPNVKKAHKTRLQQLEAGIVLAQTQTLDSARDLSIILTSGFTHLLQRNVVRETIDLKDLATEAFRTIAPIPPVEDLLGALQRTFGTYRQPTALLIYAAGLYRYSLNDNAYRAVLKSLGAHILSVFNKTYTQERYDPTKNFHLQRLNEHNPDLLPAWQVNSEAALVNSAGLSIHSTDNPEDILLCGTELLGSCQKVDGDPTLNQGLVGYLRNGQTRLLAIKDKEGCIVARRLIRLLWNEQQQKPVLFLERLYSNIDNPGLDDALLEEAKKMAKRLDCPLTCLNLPGKKLEDYSDPLQSLGGSAPEYVDGAGGLREGPYTIHVAQLIHDPSAAAAEAAAAAE